MNGCTLALASELRSLAAHLQASSYRQATRRTGLSAASRRANLDEFDMSTWLTGGAPGPLLVEELAKDVRASVQRLESKARAGAKMACKLCRHLGT